MVCARCQKTMKKTELATPGVKRKTDAYLASPAGDKGKSGSSSSATLHGSGIGKSKLLGKSAKNPYAAYSSTCETCRMKVAQGYKFCQRCAYKASNACAMCGKSQNKSTGSGPLIQGAKFSAK